ncbi:hypothetical protein QBC39DRAFT_350688 [Podospora conica]|nr:hypothetical protein QBC39DRAFT_350688 [Schizothecium conicum]
MRDPMGEPGFRTGLAKPIPGWMQPFRRRGGGSSEHPRGREGLSNTLTVFPEESSSSDHQGSEIPGVDGPGSTKESDNSLSTREPPFVTIEPLRLRTSRSTGLVTVDVNISSTSLGVYHTPPETPSRESSLGKKRSSTVLDVTPEERRESVETLPDRRKRSSPNPIKYSTGKDHRRDAGSFQQKLGKVNQTSVQSSGSFNTPRASKSATPLSSSASRQQHQLKRKPGAYGPPTIPVRRSNRPVEASPLYNAGILKPEHNPRVKPEFIGRQSRPVVEPASAADWNRMAGNGAAREWSSGPRTVEQRIAAARDQTAARYQTTAAARDETTSLQGPTERVYFQRQVKKARSMQAELRRMFGL